MASPAAESTMALERSNMAAVAVMSKTSPVRAMSHITGVRKPTLTHANSLTKMPRFGVETQQEEELAKIFDGMDRWGIDLFQVSEYSNRHPLTAIMYTIFKVNNPQAHFVPGPRN